MESGLVVRASLEEGRRVFASGLGVGQWPLGHPGPRRDRGARTEIKALGESGQQGLKFDRFSSDMKKQFDCFSSFML